MQLNDYLLKHHITSERFARLAGVSVSAVSKWRTRERRAPKLKIALRIEKITNGKVKLKDWPE